MKPELPYVTKSISRVEGELRVEPEDFVVTEIPAYEPSGTGEHVFVWFEKRGLTTPQAARRIAEAAGAQPSAGSWAGLKDKHAVTRQWISIAGVTPEAIERTSVDNVTILRVERNEKKLRTGHLKGNRFELRVRGTAANQIANARAVLEALSTTGMPNYFGEQRFGRENLARATEWVVRRGAPPKERFKRKMLFSVLQSALFNQCVAERVSEERLGHVEEGDVLRKEETGGLFTSEDAAADQARADRWEVSSTGPMFGSKMMWPTGAAKTREEALLGTIDVTPDRLRELRQYGPGTRRVVRVRPTETDLIPEEDGFRLCFALPKGSYATVLVREILKRDADAPNKR